jgi:hypothetical protein
MMDVLYDIRLIQAIYVTDGQFSSDEMKDALVAGVLEKHKITQAELDSSLLWYSDNIQSYSAINDSVASRLKAKSEALTSYRMALNSKGRHKLDLIIPTYYHLDEYTPTLSFTIDSSRIKNIKDINAFHLKFDVQGLSHSQKAEAAVYFTYKDTSICKVTAIDKNQHYALSKPQLPDSLLKGITGYIHIKNPVGIPSNILLYNISYIDSLGVSQREVDKPATTPENRSESRPIQERRLEDIRPERPRRPEKLEEVKEIKEVKNIPTNESVNNKETKESAAQKKEVIEHNPLFRGKKAEPSK